MSVTHNAYKVLLLWKRILLVYENICEMYGSTKVIWVKYGNGIEKGELNCAYEKLQVRSMIH